MITSWRPGPHTTKSAREAGLADRRRTDGSPRPNSAHGGPRVGRAAGKLHGRRGLRARIPALRGPRPGNPARRRQRPSPGPPPRLPPPRRPPPARPLAPFIAGRSRGCGPRGPRQAALTLRVREGDHGGGGGGGGGGDRGASGPTLRSRPSPHRSHARGRRPARAATSSGNTQPPSPPGRRAALHWPQRSQWDTFLFAWRLGAANQSRPWLVIGGAGRAGREGAAGRWREGVCTAERLSGACRRRWRRRAPRVGARAASPPSLPGALAAHRRVEGRALRLSLRFPPPRAARLPLWTDRQGFSSLN